MRTSEPDDAGVIAIVVALSVSTFLLGFAALAVDLGSAYARKAEVQSVADRLAIAGARGLPETQLPGGAMDEITKTLTEICADEKTPGICPDDGSAPNLGWALDGNPDNGQVSFYTDPDGDGKFSLSDVITNLATPSTAVRVELPPSRVEFGLASAIGFDSADLKEAATARVGTPIGAGILPIALTQEDLNLGQFCVRNNAAGGPTTSGTVQFSFTSVLPGGARDGVSGQQLDVQLISLLGNIRGVKFYATNSPTPDGRINADSIPGRTDAWEITVPVGEAGTKAYVWATGTEGPENRGFSTDPNQGLITYTGTLTPGADLCRQPAANRGYLRVARPEPGNRLTTNIRSSPKVNLYPTGGLLGNLGASPVLRCMAQTFGPASTCVTTQISGSFGQNLARGLLNASGNTPGRLTRQCGAGTVSFNGRQVDASDLFDGTLLATGPESHGSGDLLKRRLTRRIGSPVAGAGDRGWITSQALRCGRLAVLPVIDENPLAGITGGHSITKFTYVWIDDDTAARGLEGNQYSITALRGYVIDPGFLPAVVSGSPLVGPYLGGNMPKEALLIHDLGESPT